MQLVEWKIYKCSLYLNDFNIYINGTGICIFTESQSKDLLLYIFYYIAWCKNNGTTRLVAGAYFIIFTWSIWTRMCSYSIACVKPRYMSHYRQFSHQADYIFLLTFYPFTLLLSGVIIKGEQTILKAPIPLLQPY